MIRRTFVWLCKCILIVAAASVMPSVLVAANPVATEITQAELVSEATAVQPGHPFWVALRLQMRKGWHTYWRNPGDTGLPTTIQWSLPAGFKAGDIHWPYPEPIPVIGSLMNYGYHGEVYLLVQLTPPAALPDTGSLTLQAHAKWLVCEEVCIPEEARLALSLPITDEPPAPDPRWVEAFAGTRQTLPNPSPWAVSFETTPEALILHIATTELAAEQIEDLWFFPFADGVIDYAAPQTVDSGENGIALAVSRGSHRDIPFERVEGVIVLKAVGSDPAVQAFRIAAEPMPAPTGTAPSAGTSATPRLFPITSIPTASLWREILFAFLGGVILNLMPCVFPVLSIKAMSLIDKSQKAPWEVRRHGLVFAAGVLGCFAIIAGVLIALRAGGAQLGWGFQLQSPVFVTLLAYLMFAVGLSLSGVFTLGNTLMGLGDNLASRSGYLGSFATGALTTLVATPCTAPFMGVALGFALTQPWHIALTVFQALGFGLAFPYLLLSFSPALFRHLPRPGPWMKSFKELLAFPMYISAAWLVWVLTLQTGSEGIVTALAGIILIAFAGWLFQSTRLAHRHARVTGSIAALLVLALAIGLVTLPVFNEKRGFSVALRQSGQGPVWTRFTTDKLVELRAAGKPVFLNFTAAWCITCLANERLALSSPRLAEAFSKKGIVYLKADWTNRDPEITRVLRSFGRSGVPLYVYYPPGVAKPVILPQLLTESVVLEKLDLLTVPKTLEVYY